MWLLLACCETDTKPGTNPKFTIKDLISTDLIHTIPNDRQFLEEARHIESLLQVVV